MRASMRPSVLPGVRSVSTVSYRPMDEFHQTLVDDVVEGTDELIRF